MRETNRVIIVGAGPVGLMLAGELALAGIRATVLDRETGVGERAPGVAINAACAEFLDQRGLLDTIREECFVLPGVHFSLMFLDMSEQSAPHEDAYVVPQQTLTEILQRNAIARGATVLRGHAVTGLTATEGAVTVTVRGPGGDHELTADYLIGADGRDSTVRRLAGIGFPGTEDPSCRGVIGEVDLDMSELSMEHFGAYVSPEGGIYTAAPSGPDLMRITTIEYGSDVPPGTEPTEAEFRAAVERVTGVPLRCREVRWVNSFTDATRLAETFTAGRVFLAGDAAHAFFPTNGFGLGIGLGDAVNLGWKLAATLRGDAPDGLLATYQEERYPLAEHRCVVTRAQGELLHPVDKVEPVRAMFRELFEIPGVQRRLIDLVAGVDVSYPWGERPLLGTRLAPYELVRTDERAGKTTVAEVLRDGRGVLLRFGRDTVAPDGWRDRVDVVTADAPAGLDATALLVRPDGHIAWLADGAGETGSLTGALARWFGAPQASC
jgi:2-polyprenyl-6-methoxyphenol hydroxylase-like FAD-dependent oxidoreductase